MELHVVPGWCAEKEEGNLRREGHAANREQRHPPQAEVPGSMGTMGRLSRAYCFQSFSSHTELWEVRNWFFSLPLNLWL